MTAAIERPPHGLRAVGRIAAQRWPYLPGSTLPVRVDGFPVPYHVSLVGKGRLTTDGTYEIPSGTDAGAATVIAGNAAGIASRTLRIADPPRADRAALAVAAYDDGIVFHDAANFSVIGVLSTGGAPSDVVVDRRGRLAATDTQGTAATIVTLQPWSVARVNGAPLGDAVAVDDATGGVFVTDRDVGGKGALTRIEADGRTTTVTTGLTAEGLAVDQKRGLVYVANVNDGTVAVVDAAAMRVVRRFPAVDRVFSLALSPDGTILYAVSNQSVGSPFGTPGSVVALAVARKGTPVIARSDKMTFPVGLALDAERRTLFVTDEALDAVYVLDARTLQPRGLPLPTCRIPWEPSFDSSDDRLYVPCAGDDRVDVRNAATLRRVAGAPFATGGYPLAVTVWHPRPAAKRSFPR